VIAEEDDPRRPIGLGLHRRDCIGEHDEVDGLAGIRARRQGRQPCEVPARGEADHADPRRPGVASPPDLVAQLRERHGVPRVQGVAEHARTQAELLLHPGGDRLGLVRCMLRIAAARQHDHVRSR